MDGVVQSAALDRSAQVEGYWSALLPNVRPRRALILGLGGGTIVQLLRRRFGELDAVGVELDPAIVELARVELGLDLDGLELVLEDVFTYLPRLTERFDYICIDLFRGGEPDRRIQSRPFLRQLKALASPGAELAFNLFQDRRTETTLKRIERVFTVRSIRIVGENVVAKFGAR